MKQEAERQKSMEQGRAGLSVFKKGKDLTQRTPRRNQREARLRLPRYGRMNAPRINRQRARDSYEILTSECIVVCSTSLAVSQSFLAADSGAIRATHCTATFKPKEEAFHGSQRKSNP